MAQRIVKGGGISLYGIQDAGSMWDAGYYGGKPVAQKWPDLMTLPANVPGGGKPFKVVERFEAALQMIDKKMADPKTNPKCDSYFRGLGNLKLGLSQILAWKKIVFYRWGTPNIAVDMQRLTGATVSTETETLWSNVGSELCQIAVDPYEMRSVVTLAATIVHEFAHVAGAPGRPDNASWAGMSPQQQAGYYAAENALKECGFSKQHNPAIYGEIIRRFQAAGPLRRLA